MCHFSPHLIFTYLTLQFIWIVDNDAFHTIVMLVNILFNKGRILIKNCISGIDTLQNCRKNFQVSNFNYYWSLLKAVEFLRFQGEIQHAYLVINVFKGSVRSEIRWDGKLCMHSEARTFSITVCQKLLTSVPVSSSYTPCLKEVGHFYLHDNFGKNGPFFVNFTLLHSERIRGGSLS